MGFANLLISRLESAMQFAARLFLQLPGLLGEYFGVLDAKTSVPEVSRTPCRARGAAAGEVAFEAVSFAYPGGPGDPAGRVLRGSARQRHRPGRRSTGAGKSTAMNLLQRLWDPTAGRRRSSTGRTSAT